MNDGLEGVIAAATVLSHADGESGAVWVRGHTIERLAAEHGYEGAVAVMWEGFAGDGLTRASMREALAAARVTAFARSGEWLACAAPRPLAGGVRISLAAAALSGYCACCGPLHGGGPGLALDMLDEIEASGDVDGWIEQKLASGGRLMGFGHRVFRHRDPRADLLRAALKRLDPDAARLGFVVDVERRAVAALQRRKPGRRVEANIEMDAGLLLDAIGLPRQAFTPVFAVARCAAWLAHAMEQRQTGRMIRPASTYIGPIPAEAAPAE